MYVVLVDYTAPLAEVDYSLPDHIEWLGRQYEAGHFLASGRRVDHAGDVIVTRPMVREKLTALLATDPWVRLRLVHYQIVEFQATRTARELAACNEAVPSR